MKERNVPAANRERVFRLSRGIICLVVAGSLGTLWLAPSSVLTYILDVLFRTYLVFLGTVMAHEGVHGHLGRSKAANFWWGRLALLPSMVPFTNFRKTHHLHHAHTNLPDQDPDHFMKPRYTLLEIPFRAVAMPHHWLIWLRKRGRIRRSDLVDLGLNYLGILAVFGGLLIAVGPSRLFWGMAPVLVLVSVILWYPFAFKTHEGFSTGAPESRSHDYYGALMYWFSLGLSMHREHHLKPQLSWLELKHFVKEAPPGSGFLPTRDFHPGPGISTARPGRLFTRDGGTDA